MNTIILFDLENALIWDWTEDRRLMCSRFPEISEWIRDQGDFRAGLFSWAIWNDKDLAEFNERGGVRDDIEITHKFKFEDDLIITRGQLCDRFRVWFKKPWIRDDDFIDFFNKTMAIQALWEREFDQPNTRVILFDDTVKNITMTRTCVENNTLELVNPWLFINGKD